MRILMALTYYYPHWTGLTALAQRLAEGLVARGHQVTVVTSRYHREMRRDETHNGVRIVRLDSILRLSRGRVMPAFLPTINRLLADHDIVQAHTPMLETWLVGLLAHRAGRPLVMTNHGDLVMPAGPWNQFVQRTVGYFLDRGAEVADMITTHSQDYAEHSDYMRPFAAKVVGICPIVVTPPPDLAAVAAWRRELGLEGRPLVGFAGRFVEEKGFDYLLKAIPRVAAERPDVRFVFAGEHRVVYERFYEQCRPLIEAQRERLVMLGLITDRQKLADFYAMCDVFTLPSRTDSFASVQVESMLCGTPVVATDIPGGRQAVLRSGMGILVAPQDERALAEGILQVLRDPAAYVQPAEDIAAVFSTERSIDEYERLFASLIRGEPFVAEPELTLADVRAARAAREGIPADA